MQNTWETNNGRKLPAIAQRRDKHCSLWRRCLLSFCHLPHSPLLAHVSKKQDLLCACSHTDTHAHPHAYTAAPSAMLPASHGSCTAVLSVLPRPPSLGRRLCSPLVPPPGVSEPLLLPKAPLQPTLPPGGSNTASTPPAVPVALPGSPGLPSQASGYPYSPHSAALSTQSLAPCGAPASPLPPLPSLSPLVPTVLYPNTPTGQLRSLLEATGPSCSLA